jgi:uncharacterized protein (DUF305 family)
MTRSPLRIWLAAVVALVAAGCTGPAAPVSAPAPAAAPSSELSELEALYHARADSALVRHTAADVRFMTEMIPHHAQAIEMGRMARTREAGAQLQVLAARIVRAQEDEISLMQEWLRQRGHPVPELHVMGERVMVHGPGGHDHHGAHPHAGMPGMLGEEQIRQLGSARGAEFERLFLTFMIHHHRGAMAMVDELFASDGAAQDAAVFQLASDIHVDQLTEIARMERMLASLSAGGLAQ